MNAPPCATIEIKVPFHDCDALAMVWHGHYAKYFELARCALLESIDYSYEQMAASGYLWPVIDLHVRYVQALRFNQRVRVTATLQEWEYRLKIGYLISDVISGQRLTRGHSIQVAVTLDSRELQLASPEVLRRKLEAMA